jgi:hypothetical protein
MRGRWIAYGLVGLALVLAPPARAQAVDDPGSDRRGLYVRLGGGPGYSSGDYRYNGLSHALFGQPVVPLSFQTQLHGAHAEFAGAVGHSLARGLAVAASGTVRIVPVPVKARLASTELETTVLASLGIVIDFFPLPAEETHLTAGAGWATGAFMYGRNDEASPDNIVEPEAVDGPIFQGGAGYRLTPRFDLLAQASYARLESAHSAYRPLGVTVLASWLLF